MEGKEDCRENEDDSLDQWKITLRDRGHRERPESGPAEDTFRQNRSSEKRSESDPENAHHRKESVSEGMGNDSGVGKPARAGAAHVDFVKRIEKRRPYEAARDGSKPEAQGEGRKDEMREGAPAHGRKQAPMHGEERREQNSEPEHRNRDPELGEDHDREIGERAPLQGRDHAQDTAERHSEQERRERELQSRRESLRDELRDRRPLEQRHAEVARRDAFEVARELHGPGVVESKRVPQLGHVFRSRVLPEKHHGRVSGHESEERGNDDRHSEERDNEDDQPTSDVA